MKVRMRVPATTANLGPGFDVFGAALSVYNEFEAATVENGKGGKIVLKGEGKIALPKSEKNLVWQAMKETFKVLGETKYNFKNLNITINTGIPLSGGLGSSASAIVGGIALANALCGLKLNKSQITELAVKIEGHPDNVAPAVFGGVCVCSKNDQNPHGEILHLPVPKLKVVLCVPSFELRTKRSRQILPKCVNLQDVVFNTSGVAFLTAAFCTGDWTLLKKGTQDKIHQPYRGKMIPAMNEVLRAAIDAGAYGAYLSGSGPTLAAFCDAKKAETVKKEMTKIWKKESVAVKSYILDFDKKGVERQS
ncbi:homoserine kinase [Endomicrobium proavitum]|uniref:Homoserine kinase n=1 Tax=Endomicrobium proavitum TaxID=1408281 RepID=A0A0G3WM49_9BACT|nr:homoserine kinase [Endomicrobium proavitum]AKL98544.1 Homoserine kinase [Endomicrobium proavitum]